MRNWWTNACSLIGTLSQKLPCHVLPVIGLCGLPRVFKSISPDSMGPGLCLDFLDSHIYMKWNESCSVVFCLFATPWTVQSKEFSRQNIPQNTEVDILSLFQGIFPTQGLNPGLLHCRRIHYQLSHKGSPRMNWWSKEGIRWSTVMTILYMPTIKNILSILACKKTPPYIANHSKFSAGKIWYYLFNSEETKFERD